MANFIEATVVEITNQRRGLQRIKVLRHTADSIIEPAYVLTDLIGEVETEDHVVVNTTAVDLKLGTGGWHFVSANLSHPEWRGKSKGHVLKLRYTPMQTDRGVIDERADFVQPTSLQDIPVTTCFLHSQIAPVIAAAKQASPKLKIAYVMTDTAGLAYALSDLVHDLWEQDLIEFSITAGQAFGGDHESVNVVSACLAAKALGAQAIVVAPGPGVVGTSTKFGFGSLDLAGNLQMLSQLGATTILCARYSDGDSRERHLGVSHHTKTVLEMTTAPTTIAIPKRPRKDDVYSDAVQQLKATSKKHKVVRVDTPDVEVALDAFDISVTTMGRKIDADRGFFEVSAAAGILAAQLSGVELAVTSKTVPLKTTVSKTETTKAAAKPREARKREVVTK